MNSCKKLVLYILPFYGLFALAVCYAQDQKGQMPQKADLRHEGRAKMLQKSQEIYNQLNLTDDQKKLLEASRAKNKEGMKALFEKMKSCRDALNSELIKPNLNMAKIDEINSQLKAAQAQLIDERLASIIEVRKILTVEQFAKFLLLNEKRKPAN